MPASEVAMSRTSCFSFLAFLILLGVGLGGIASISEGGGMANTASRSLSPRKMSQTEIPQDVRETMDPTMVDFVVAGFQKCGTTYLQNKILYPSKRIFIPHHETHYLQNDKFKQFVGEFENATKSTNHDGKPLLSGYKAPFVLGHHRSLRNLEALFPDIHMVITLRHPVLAFESLYNYKLRQSPEPLPPVDTFVGLCGELCPRETERQEASIETTRATRNGQSCLDRDEIHWCTGVMNYHMYLSRLGLTPMNTSEELDLLGNHPMSIYDFWGSKRDVTSSVRGGSGSRSGSRSRSGTRQRDTDARLFLIEIGQFDNRANQSMAEDVNADLETFLGLDPGDLPRPLPQNGMERPKVRYSYPSGYEEYILDICLDRYKPLREVLLDTSQRASRWIRKYLLHPSNRQRVVVSNIEIFERLLEGWDVDPCSDEEEGIQ